MTEPARSSVSPLFVAPPCRQQARGEILLRDIGRVQSRLVPGRRRSSLDLAGRHWSLNGRGLRQIWRFRKQGARKGIWSKVKGSNEGTRCLHQPFDSRAVVEAAWGSGDAQVQSSAMRRPRLQAVGARGAPHLPFGFATKPSPSAPWAQGYCRRPGNGGPQTCLPAARCMAEPAGCTAHLHQQGIQDPREGPSLTRRMT